MQDGLGNKVSEGLTVQRVGSVLVLSLAAKAGQAADPLVDPSLRGSLIDTLTHLPPDLAAVLLSVHGADAQALPEAGDAGAKTAQDLRHLANIIEDAPVPVAILLGGHVAGPLADLALAARARLAGPDVRIGFSALSIGHMPQAGGSLRLPRLVGAEQALRLWRTAKAIPVEEAVAIGLIDHVVEAEDRATAALAAIQAGEVPAMLDPPRDAGLRDGRAFLSILAAERAAMAGRQVLAAEAALLQCMEAALLLPPAQAKGLEEVMSAEVAQSDVALALTHIRRAELRAAEGPAALAALPVTPTRHLGVAGVELGLAGVVLTALARGRKITIADPDKPRLVQFLEAVAARQEVAVQEGRLTADQRDSDWARLVATLDLGALDGCDLIIATSETAPNLARRGRPLLVTGRGALSADALRLTLTARMAELALPAAAVGPVVRQSFGFLTSLGLQVVLTGQQAPSGIAGRLSSAGGLALRRMSELGVPAEAIISAMVNFGLPAPNLAASQPAAPRDMAEDEILWRWLSALANEGARLLAAGVVSSPLDIDLVAVAGLGFPRHRGGPLHMADQRGLIIVRRDLLRWASEGDVWTPVPALDALVSVGRGFSGSIKTG